MPWVKNGVEYSENQIRAAHPNTSFPAPIELNHVTDFGYVWEEPPVPPPPGPPPIPSVVSMRQARLALLGAGLLTPVNAALAAMEGIEGEAARIEWEYATEVVRSSALVAGLSGALGLTSEQLDNLFTAAVTL